MKLLTKKDILKLMLSKNVSHHAITKSKSTVSIIFNCVSNVASQTSLLLYYGVLHNDIQGQKREKGNGSW